MNMWDERYGKDMFHYGTEPNDFLRAHAADLPAGGQVLCIGEGEGRNAVFLAQQGFAVTAVDGSAVGLQKLQRLAAERGVAVTTVVADLSTHSLGDATWDAVVAIWVHLPSTLRGRVHRAAVRALRPGGVFLLESYTPRQLAFGTGGPQQVDMLPTAAGLREELAGLDPVILHEIERDVHEGAGHAGMSAVVQVLARKA